MQKGHQTDASRTGSERNRVLDFRAGRRGRFQLPQNFANISPASVTSPSTARAMPTVGGAFRVLVGLLKNTSDQLVQSRKQKL